MSEKNLPPSHQRLEQARKQGQLGISQDLVKLFKMAVIAETAFALESMVLDAMADLVSAASLFIASPRGMRWQAILELSTPLLGVCLLLACLAGLVTWALTLLQTGFNIASEAMEQGPKKLNPVSNLKQIFSSQKLLMLGLGPLKIGSVLFVVAHELQSWIPTLVQADRITPAALWQLSLTMLQRMERSSLIILLAWAIFDVALQRWQTYRGLRMDLEELKQDHKSSEGDPHVKGHRKSTARQMLFEPPAAKLPKPTAVVVNPQHIAIAIAYRFEPNTLPRIVAKGRDRQAQSIRDMAAREGIPIIRYVGLARQLYATSRVGDLVQTDALRAVALVYRAVREMTQDMDPADVAGVYELDEDMAAHILAES
jgi:type III secretion protein U